MYGTPRPDAMRWMASASDRAWLSLSRTQGPPMRNSLRCPTAMEPIWNGCLDEVIWILNHKRRVDHAEPTWDSGYNKASSRSHDSVTPSAQDIFSATSAPRMRYAGSLSSFSISCAALRAE